MDSDNKIIGLLCSTISVFTATTMVHGFDVIRISQQINMKPQYTFNYLYRGYSAGLLRQLTYAVPNLTIFTELNRRHKQIHNAEPSVIYKAVFGAISGAVGGFTGTPSEVIMIRSIKPSLPTIVFTHHLRDIYANNGILSFFQGSYAAIIRSATFNSIRLSAYSESKLHIQNIYPKLEGTSTLHFASAFIGTSLGIFITNPIDYIKSQLQKPGAKKGVVDIIKYTHLQHGILGFYKGMTASLFKSVPHSIISFVILERLTRFMTGSDAI